MAATVAAMVAAMVAAKRQGPLPIRALIRATRTRKVVATSSTARTPHGVAAVVAAACVAAAMARAVVAAAVEVMPTLSSWAVCPRTSTGRP